MNCDEARVLISGRMDGELALPQSHALDVHLRGCSACAAEQERLLELSQSLATLGRAEAPADLGARVRSRLRREADVPPRAARVVGWLGRHAPSFAVGAALAALFAVMLPVRPGTPLVDEVISVHVRSLMADHLADVESSDRHTVKPWFSGRIDFAPPVQDLSSHGFRLIGGRADYVDGRPAAALVYGRRKHMINVIVYPSPGDGRRTVHSLSRQGYNLFSWSEGGLQFWTISDLGRAELGEFVDRFRAAAPSTASAP